MSKNNKLIFAAIIVIVLLIVGTVVILEWYGPPRTIVLDLPGPAGASLVGEVEVDGVIRKIEQKLPCTLTYSARRVEFAFVATENNVQQHIKIKVLVDGQFLVGGSSTGLRGAVYAPVLLSRLRDRAFFAGASNGKIRE